MVVDSESHVDTKTKELSKNLQKIHFNYSLLVKDLTTIENKLDVHIDFQSPLLNM